MLGLAQAGRPMLDRATCFYTKTDVELDDETLRALAGASDGELGLTRDIIVEAARAGGCDGDRIERAETQGTFHRLYRVHHQGRPAILKIGLFAFCAPAMAGAARAINAAHAAAIPVPALLGGDLTLCLFSFPFQIQEQAPGEMLAGFDVNEQRVREALSATAKIIAQLHEVRGEGFGLLAAECALAGLDQDWASYVWRRGEAHLARCHDAGLVSSDEAKQALLALERVGRWSVVPRLLHGDLGSRNIFVEEGRLAALIDWEDALVGEPLFDLAFFASFHPERRHDAIIDAYAIDRPLTDYDMLRFWTYFLRIALSKTVQRLRFGIEDSPGRVPASRRIQLALGRISECAS